MTSLRLGYLNIQGAKKFSLSDLEDACQGCDVFVAAETHCDAASYAVGGFVNWSSDGQRLSAKGRKSGGMLVLVNQLLTGNVSLIHLDCYFAVLALSTSPDARLLIVFVYVPTTSSTQSHREVFENLHTLIDNELNSSTQKTELVVLGDMNCRIGNELDVPLDLVDLPTRHSVDYGTDVTTPYFASFMHDFNLFILNGRFAPDLRGSFTHFSSNGNSVIDYGLASVSLSSSIRAFEVVRFPGVTDHSLIAATLAVGSVSPPVRLQMKRDKLANALRHELIFVPSMSAGGAARHLQSVVSGCVSSNVARSIAGIRQLNSRPGTYLHRQRGISHDDQRIFDALMREPTKIWQMKTRELVAAMPSAASFRSHFLEVFSTIMSGPPLFAAGTSYAPTSFYSWASLYSRQLGHPSGKRDLVNRWQVLSGQPPCKLVTPLFFDYWDRLITPCRLSTADCHVLAHGLGYFTEDVPTVLTSCPNNEGLLTGPISEEEVQSCLADCNPHSAAGADGLSYGDIRDNASVLVPFLARLFSRIMLDGEYPDDWKLALITPVFKKGDRSVASNYRPICLQNCIAKLFSKICERRLRAWLARYSPLRKEQFGFQPGTGTMDAAAVLHTAVAFALEKLKAVYCTFVDFTSAFDTISHSRLMEKLRARGVPEHFIGVLSSMYVGNNAAVFANGVCSEPFPVLAGVKQGDPLSPLLFAIFIDDLVDALEKVGCRGLQLGYVIIRAILYADDVAILAETEEDMDRYLKALYDYASSNGLKINVGKTKAMVFAKSPVANAPSFQLNGENVEIVQTFKYLGLWLDSRLLYKTAVKEAKIRMQRTIGALPSLFSNLQAFPIPALRSLYNGCVLGAYTYGAEIWGLFAGKADLADHLRFAKRCLGLAKSTSHTLLSREISLLPPKLAHSIAAIRFFFRLQDAPSESLLGNAFVGLQWMGSATRSLAKRAQALLAGAGLEYLNTSSLQANSKILLVKRRLQTLNWEVNYNSLTEKYNCHSLFQSHRVLDAACAYFSELPIEMARTALKIRCNSLLKPMQYYWHNSCPLCRSVDVALNDGWDFVTHFTLQCPVTAANMIPFRSSTQSRHFDESTLAKLVNFEDIGNDDQVPLLKYFLIQLKLITTSLLPVNTSSSAPPISSTGAH